MQDRKTLVLTSILGALAIHVAMIACSGGGSSPDAASDMDASVPDHMFDGALDAVLDAETDDARAQEDSGGGGTCGSCTVTGPIDVRLPDAPLRMITADTDPAQIEGGLYVASPTVYGTLAVGPFVLTDASSNGGQSNVWVQTAAMPCNAGIARRWGLVTDNNTAYGYSVSTHGGRYLARAGEQLCAQHLSGNGLNWSGFRPY